MSAIELRDVSVEFHEGKRTVQAVKGVSLQVQKGEIFGIVGFSGAGKSTLVRTLNLLQRPTSGKVLLDGEDITAVQGSRLRSLRKRIGFIFQGFNLITNRTVGQNINFALKAAGWPKKDRARRIKELLDIVDLGEKVDSYPASLSGGQQQRISIARALANEPEILLCDEATSALDLETTQEILSVIKRINRNLGITVVFITHELDVAKAIFDHVAVMERGTVIEQGATYDIFASPQHDTTRSLVERYLGIELPAETVAALPPGRLLEIRYKGSETYEPLISQISTRYGTPVNVLHAKIEYFGSRAIGILIILLSGAPDSVEQALRDLRDHVFSLTELERGSKGETEALAADGDGGDGADASGGDGYIAGTGDGIALKED
ncbi:MAG: ATP-binding cassette domain-containing protein [Bifidobacteriaceae bacterium]|jgi:D-methionine transport system ATP-binding protein|nr:ATP-binding cassette domain-containing protein [Bifidobacteriaceae bacterium]MCI1979637.1 ATP-binding cassette domain-containing protein [Bifidobacteriaceae bacterium]